MVPFKQLMDLRDGKLKWFHCWLLSASLEVSGQLPLTSIGTEAQYQSCSEYIKHCK